MKSEKVTSDGVRWYDDACGTALAMELVGERWSLLIVRELMFGGRRFGELKGALSGISANVLTQRLTGLEASGIVARRRLPPPANVQVYELTAWGYGAERAIQELGRWAARSPAHDPTLPMSAASLMLSLRTLYDGDGDGETLAFMMARDRFVARLAEEVVVTRGEGDAAATLTGSPETMVALIHGKVPVAALQAAGALAIDGDAVVVERFRGHFALPDKIVG